MWAYGGGEDVVICVWEEVAEATSPVEGGGSRARVKMGDIPRRFYAVAMATFMAAHHGNLTVLTYKKKKAKNSIDNSSHGLIRHGALLIIFVLATLLRPAGDGPCGRAACGCLLPFGTPHAVRPTPYAPRPTPYAPCGTPHAVPYWRFNEVRFIVFFGELRRGEAR
jgi:hypothetical protein